MMALTSLKLNADGTVGSILPAVSQPAPGNKIRRIRYNLVFSTIEQWFIDQLVLWEMGSKLFSALGAHAAKVARIVGLKDTDIPRLFQLSRKVAPTTEQTTVTKARDVQARETHKRVKRDAVESSAERADTAEEIPLAGARKRTSRNSKTRAPLPPS